MLCVLGGQCDYFLFSTQLPFLNSNCYLLYFLGGERNYFLFSPEWWRHQLLTLPFVPFFPIICLQLQCLFYNLFLVCLSFLFYTFYCSLTSMFATVFAPLLCSLHFIGSPFFTIICSLYFPLFCTLYLYTALKYTFWWQKWLLKPNG